MPDQYAAWKGWDPREFGRFSASDDAYFRWHVERAVGRSERPFNVLEIGFGNGRFLGWLQQHGHRSLGIEANSVLIGVARQAGFRAVSTLAEVPEGERFDLVAAFDVIEHIPAAELTDFVARMAASLADGGRIVLRFPNGESPFGLWMQHGDLTHVHAIGLSKIRQLCGATGLHLEHSGELLPWSRQPAKRRAGFLVAAAARRVVEWSLRKMYLLPRGLDLSSNQLVVLSRPATP